MDHGTRSARRAVIAVAALLLATSCGLKGPLTLPERSSNVVIRPAPGGTEPPAPAPQPTPEPEPVEPEEERLPPPEFPTSNRGGVGG